MKLSVKWVMCASLTFSSLIWSADTQTAASADQVKFSRNYVKTSDVKKAANYLEQLKSSGAGKDQLEKVAKARYKQKLRDMKRHYEPLEIQVDRFLDPQRRATFMKEFTDWKTSAEAAISYIFDDKTYAVPAKAKTGWIPGKDIQTNQAIVEGRVEDTITQWNAMIAHFGRLSGFRVNIQRKAGGDGFAKKLKTSKPESLSHIQIPILNYAFSEPETGIRTFEKKVAKLYAPYKAELTVFQKEIQLAKSAGYHPKKVKLKALPIAVAALYSGNISDAMTYKPAHDTDEQRIFAIYTGLYLYLKSLERPEAWSTASHDALKTNNLYRLSLGLFPLLPNDKLQLAADNHAVYQKKNGMGHFEHHKETKTPRDRARKVGYNGGVTENCYSGDMDNAIWTWRTDAGHHRNLIQPKAKVIGLSDKGLPTHNSGYVCEDKELAPLFNVSY